MKCKCCNATLSEKEIIWNDELKEWEMCTVCVDIAMDAAYSEGFTIDDEDSVVVLDTDYDQIDDLYPQLGQRWPY